MDSAPKPASGRSTNRVGYETMAVNRQEEHREAASGIRRAGLTPQLIQVMNMRCETTAASSDSQHLRSIKLNNGTDFNLSCFIFCSSGAIVVR